MMPTIRAGTKDDIPNAIPLIEEFVADSISEFGMQVTKDYAMKAVEKFVEHSLVMEKDGAIVGLIAGGFIENPLGPDLVFQEQIWFVSKAHRRYGLLLIRELEKRLLLMSCDKLIMGYMANSFRRKLHKVYKGMGFRFMECHFIKLLKDQRGFIATSTIVATAVAVSAVGAATAGIVTAAKGAGDGGAPGVAAPAGPQSFAEIESQERNKLLRNQQNKTKAVLTSPLGVTPESGGQVQRKIALGA
jgi:hypothetical protein